jgi:hypothetical protein
MSTNNDTAPTRDLGTFYEKNKKPPKGDYYRSGQDPKGTKKASEIEAAKAKAHEEKTEAVTIIKPAGKASLTDLTGNVTGMIFNGLGGSVLIFLVVAAVLMFMGLRRKAAPIAMGIGGLAALGWLYYASQHNFFQ